MSIIYHVGNGEYADLRLDPKEADKANKSEYSPSADEREVREMVIRHFTLGYQNMYTPRVEWNDMSTINRMQVDQMAFNTYQPNNGDAAELDVIQGWRSNAIRPIVRNKCISIAAHATARLIFPKVFAYSQQSEYQNDAARGMEHLMEWAAEQSNYAKTSLEAVVTSLWSPASIGYTEYGEVYRNQKTEKGKDGKWKVEKVLDEDYSGFKDTLVPVDEIFIENFYENDIQKQSWLIWRRVISYDTAKAKYGERENWKYVKPGVQVVYNDANTSFYNVYDSNMRTEMVEEVLYWNKSMDLFLPMLNGVMMDSFDNPNPRIDKQYPFWKFGYELLDEGKCFYYKSLAFKLQSDANIVNTLYPLIIDGTYLDVMPAMVNIGSETIGSDVFVPGAVTTLSDPESKLEEITKRQRNLSEGRAMLEKVEESVNESSQDPTLQGLQTKGSQTAYEISRIEQNAATNLGLFIKAISSFVKQYGSLRIGDIVQNLTIADVSKITDGPGLVYRSFLVRGTGKYGAKKLEFDPNMTDVPLSPKEKLDLSYAMLEESDAKDMEIWKANPILFRELKYSVVVSPDVLQPRSEDLERALNLEIYDRAIANPLADQEKVLSDFLFGSYKTIKDPKEYVKVMAPMPMNPLDPTAQAAAGGAALSPLQQKPASTLPNAPSTGRL